VGFPPQPARPPCCLNRNDGIRGQGKAVGTNADGFAIYVRLLSQRPNARPPLPAPGLLLRNNPTSKGLRSLGERGVLCAPTAHQTNGINGVSPERGQLTNLKSIIGRVRAGNYHRNYSHSQKSSIKNSSKSKTNNARARTPLPAALDYRGHWRPL
jgi:hypothetical protein